MYEEAALKIITPAEPKVVVTITLTSPVMREGDDAEHGSYFCVVLLDHGALDKSSLRCNIAKTCLE